MECNVHFAIQISQWHKKSSQNHSKNNLWLCILKIKFTKIKMRLHDKKNKKKNWLHYQLQNDTGLKYICKTY